MIRLMVSGGSGGVGSGGGGGGGGVVGMLLLPPFGKASSNLLSVLEAELRRTVSSLAATSTPLLFEPSTTVHSAVSRRAELQTLTHIFNTLLLLSCHPDLAAEMVQRHFLKHLAQWDAMKPFYGGRVLIPPMGTAHYPTNGERLYPQERGLTPPPPAPIIPNPRILHPYP
jgi:hypothetical protein